MVVGVLPGQVGRHATGQATRRSSRRGRGAAPCPAGSWPPRDASRPKREARPHRPALVVAETTADAPGRRRAPAGSTDRRRCGAARRRRAGPASRSPARPAAHRPRGGGAALPDARPVEPRDREDAGDQPEDGRQPRRARLPKIGVSNRAAASLFAMRHGLVPELTPQPNDQTSSSVGTPAVSSCAGSSVNRNASPSCSGSAREERSSAPRPTKTWVRGADGMVTVWRRRAGPPRRPRRARARPPAPARRAAARPA